MIRRGPGGVSTYAATNFGSADHASTILVAGLVATTLVAVTAVAVAVTLWRRQQRPVDPVDVTAAPSFAAAAPASPWGADERIDLGAAVEPFVAATRYFTAEAAGTSPVDTLARPARRHGRRHP